MCDARSALSHVAPPGTSPVLRLGSSDQGRGLPKGLAAQERPSSTEIPHALLGAGGFGTDLPAGTEPCQAELSLRAIRFRARAKPRPALPRKSGCFGGPQAEALGLLPRHQAPASPVALVRAAEGWRREGHREGVAEGSPFPGGLRPEGSHRPEGRAAGSPRQPQTGKNRREAARPSVRRPAACWLGHSSTRSDPS